MNKNEEPIDDEESYFQVYSTNDNDSMKTIGQIIKTPRSLKIFQLLVDEELTSSEIGKRIEKIDNPRLPILSHHLQKMVKVGLLTSSVKRSTKRGREKTYYKAKSEVIIFAKEEVKEKISGSTKIKDLFKELVNDTKGTMLRGFMIPFGMLAGFVLWRATLPIDYVLRGDWLVPDRADFIDLSLVIIGFSVFFYFYVRRSRKLDILEVERRFSKD